MYVLVCYTAFYFRGNCCLYTYRTRRRCRRNYISQTIVRTDYQEPLSAPEYKTIIEPDNTNGLSMGFVVAGSVCRHRQHVAELQLPSLCGWEVNRRREAWVFFADEDQLQRDRVEVLAEYLRKYGHKPRRITADRQIEAARTKKELLFQAFH